MTHFIFDHMTTEFLRAAISEDMGKEDMTSHALIDSKARLGVQLLSKQQGVLAGLDLAHWLYCELDPNVDFQAHYRDGDTIETGTQIADVVGNARALLVAERVVLNFMQRLSGIATLTQQFVHQVSEYPAVILDTRKTTPNFREFEKYAVLLGGGKNHRFGLWDQILIKENHLLQMQQQYPASSFSDLISQSIRQARAYVPKGTRIEIEVETIKQALSAYEAEPDIILLDNMSVLDIQTCMDGFKRGSKAMPLVEVSGNLSLENIGEIAATGVDRLSVGALTHSYCALDLSVRAFTV